MNRIEPCLAGERAPQIEAIIDGVYSNVLKGWAWFPSHPERVVLLEISVENQAPIRIEANLYRQDLANAGKRRGYCAFEAPLIGPAAAKIYVKVVDLDGGALQCLDAGNWRTEEAPVRSLASWFPQTFSPESGLHGFIDQLGPVHVKGWVIATNNPGASINLAVFESGRQIMEFSANRWRDDLAELRDGKGCCGFEATLPQQLYDGNLHVLDIRIAGTDVSVLTKPLWVVLPNGNPSSNLPAPLARPDASSPPLTLSIIVIFYNMPREAARTLRSLTRSYQVGCGDIDYEVLCVDNGSHPPLDSAWIESFGPEFRLIRPSKSSSSPCSAINEAALLARGRYLGIMIDGAHVLTPGIFKEARLAWQEDPQAVVAIRHWFIGGDQRWLAEVGYSREQEDLLFERISWPINGYEMFRIGAPIGESPEPWFDGLTESNCLLLPTPLYDQIGGIDEGFDEAGGGFANLDLWCRAADQAKGQLIALIGEATFHQYHGGTTTNVGDNEKDARVRTYSNKYRQLRGTSFPGVQRDRLRFRGKITASCVTGIRQRPLLPMALAITDRIRPGQLAAHFEPAAQDYLQSVYAECGLHAHSRWLGQPTGIAPGDLLNIQEILRQLQPDCVVIAGGQPGLVNFVDNILDMLGMTHARVLDVGNPDHRRPQSPRILAVHGVPAAIGTRITVGHALLACEKVLVLYAAGAETTSISEALIDYGNMVSHRSWLVCLDVLMGQPWLGYSTRRTSNAIRDYVATHKEYVIDRSWNRHLISTSPDGYLRKIGNMVSSPYDSSMDDLSTFDCVEA